MVRWRTFHDGNTQMAGVGTDYSFDFEKEVEQAFNDFPQLRSSTVFVDAEQPSEIHSRSGSAMRDYAATDISSQIEKWIKEKKSSVVFHASFGSSVFHAVLLNERHDISIIYPPDVNKAFTLDHEMGHALTAWPNSEIGWENAADAFAAIRHLQRFGNDPRMLVVLSCFRSYETADRDNTSHMTMPVINQIISDSKRFDFSSLSPEETVKAAEDYAREYTPSLSDEKYALSFAHTALPFYRILRSKKRRLEFMASTALTTPDRFSFQIGLSAFRPFLDPEGAMLEGRHIKFDLKTREKFRAAFVERARYFWLDGLASELEENKADMLAAVSTPAPEKRPQIKNPALKL